MAELISCAGKKDMKKKADPKVYGAAVLLILAAATIAAAFWLIAFFGAAKGRQAAEPAGTTYPTYYTQPAQAPDRSSGRADFSLTAEDTRLRLDRYTEDVFSQYGGDTPQDAIRTVVGAGNATVGDTEPKAKQPAAATGAQGHRANYEASDTERKMLAQTVYGEAVGEPPEEQALVVWTVLNRLDDGRFGDSIAEILTRPNQFIGYSPKHPVTDAILAVVDNALKAYADGDSAPTLPPYAKSGSYLYFSCDKAHTHNWFR